MDTDRRRHRATALTLLLAAALVGTVVACRPRPLPLPKVPRPAPTTTRPATTAPTTAPRTAPTTSTTSVPGQFGPGVVTVADPERAAVTDGVGAFRIVCQQSHSSSDDPLVHPGHPGMSHLHQFFGSRTTDAFSTTASLMQGTSSCKGGTANRSAYWSPAMLDGDGREVPASWAITYYKSGYGGVEPAAVRPMPAGLRMLSGEPARTARDDRPSWERDVFWFCQQPQADLLTPRVAEMPQCPAGSELVMSVQFPQCWDGVRLDSPDHRSHMAHADPSFPGGCPGTHPVPIPAITENVHWDVPASNASWRLASDMYDGPAGRSGHADWWNGWDPAVVEVWMRNCVNAGVDCHAEGLGDGRRLG